MDVRGISGPKSYSLGYFLVPDAELWLVAPRNNLLRSELPSWFRMGFAISKKTRIGGAEMTRILSDDNSQILTAPWSDPLEGGRGVIVQNYCHCISWEKATTIKMRLSKMLFFLCSRPTMKFQGGSPVDPLLEAPADPPFDSTSQKLFLSSFRRL